MISLQAVALATTVSVMAAAAAAASEGPAAPRSGQTATVCPSGCPYSRLQQALDLAGPGDIVTVGAGVYDDCGVVKKPLRLIGLTDPAGRRAHLKGGVCWGKGALVLRAPNIVVEGFEISDIAVPSKNGACIRIDPEAGDVTVRDIYCHDSENGILGGPARGTVRVEDSRFERNGGNDGFAHGLYINRGNRLEFRRSEIVSTKKQGHGLKSGAKHTIIEDSLIAALEGHTSRAVDLYGGGIVELRRNVIQQGPNSDNNEAIGIALEPKRLNPPPHRTTIEDNWFIFDDFARCCRLLLRADRHGPIHVRNNNFVGMTSYSASGAEITRAGNTEFETRQSAGLPSYDRTIRSFRWP